MGRHRVQDLLHDEIDPRTITWWLIQCGVGVLCLRATDCEMNRTEREVAGIESSLIILSQGDEEMGSHIITF